MTLPVSPASLRIPMPRRMAPEGVGVVNPSFDVTDHSLVTGIITEKGIAYEPFKESFEKMGIKPVEKYVDKK